MFSMNSFAFFSLASIAIYLDPGSGSFLIQLLIAGVAALGIGFASQWSKIKRLFGKKKAKPDETKDEDEDQESNA
jgi:hypothetical protein